MKLLNARFGFATNSSSTHSIIIRPGLTDKIEGEGFGWERFTLASKEEKTRYLAAALAIELRQWVPQWALGNVLRSWLDIDSNVLTDSDIEELGIDHQSDWSLPMDRFEYKSYGVQWPSREFVADLKKFLLETPDLAILGGNDNEDEPHPMYDETAFNLPIQDIEGPRLARPLLARKDKKDGYWTVFNMKTGTRLRFHFDPKDKVPDRAWSPELVDLAITHKCDVGCDFCFAGATPNGKDADRETLYKIIQALGKLGVFEIAFGGGEPTQYPGFFDFLSTCRYNGIVPNFSTRDLSWLLDKRVRHNVVEHVGGFAVSCSSDKDVDLLEDVMGRFPEVSKKVSVQIIFGVVPEWHWYSIMSTCAKNDWPVTVLGFKNVGRGKGFKQEKYKEGLPYPFSGKIQDGDDLPQIGIDTTLAKQIEPLLKKVDLPWFLYEVKEGTHSMAIDAVDMTGAPSSFSPENERVSIKATEKSIGEAFRSWQNDV